MATTTFVDGSTLSDDEWFNDTDALVYQGNLATALNITAGDTSSGDIASIGYTTTEGLILTGQGSTNDLTIKNDADADVIVVPTGTTNVDIVGTATAAAFEPDGDTASGDNAAIGYTTTEGLIITGQGSTNDITVKNDADADVITIATGTTNVDIVGDVTALTVNADGDTTAGDNAVMGYTSSEGLILTGQGSTNDITIKNDADANVLTVATGTTTVTLPGVLSVDDVTDTTSGTSGSVHTDGGLGIVKALFVGTNVTADAYLASADDSGALGASGTAFSDLFLASGSVINFNAGDVTLTHSSNTLALIGGVLAITTADVGVANADADELLLENTANTGFTILSSTTGTSNIYFGDGGSATIGRLVYDNNANSLDFFINGSEGMSLDGGTGLTINSGYILSLDDTTNSTSATTGSFHTDGGVGIAKDVFCDGYIKLKITDTDGGTEGEIWYDASEDKLKFKTAAGVETITSS